MLTYNPESSSIAKNVVNISFLDFIKKILLSVFWISYFCVLYPETYLFSIIDEN